MNVDQPLPEGQIPAGSLLDDRTRGEHEARPSVLANQLIQSIDQATELYYRLILIAAPAGKGKTRVLQEMHKLTGAPLVSVDLEFSRAQDYLFRVLEQAEFAGKVMLFNGTNTKRWALV